MTTPHSRYVYAETPAGDYACTLSQGARGDNEATTHQTLSRERAVSECLRLADVLRNSDPVRAQQLTAAAEDARKTAFELYREVKQDGRTTTVAAGPRELSDGGKAR